MTLQEFIAELSASKRTIINEANMTHLGVRFAVWPHARYWFCAVDGADGYGFAEDRESAVMMAKAKIEENE